MNPDIVGCDKRNEYTDIRCGLPIVVELDNGEAYCQYCAPEHIEDRDIAMAVRNIKRAGLI